MHATHAFCTHSHVYCKSCILPSSISTCTLSHLLAMRSSVPTTIASGSTVTKHVELNGTEEGKTNKSRSRHYYYAITRSRRASFANFVSRRMLCLPWSSAPLALALSLSSSSALLSPNNSSRPSQRSAGATPAACARPSPFKLLFCGNSADGGVSGLL